MLLAPPEGHSSGAMALLGMGQVSVPRLRAVASPSKHGSRHREGTAGGMPCREKAGGCEGCAPAHLEPTMEHRPGIPVTNAVR